MKAERPTGLLASPSQSLVVWWTAIRPRTLSIAATPVALGSALAWADGASPVWTVLLATLACALLIQVGTNLHNDVADFERGTDRPDRVGPLRVTAAGWVQPASVRMAARSSFGLALLLGFYLVVQGGWPILLMGMASLVAGWSYSGGARPISHTAWGEVFVLVFFGLVAVAGSHWLQQGDAWVDALLCGFIVGFPAAAVPSARGRGLLHRSPQRRHHFRRQRVAARRIVERERQAGALAVCPNQRHQSLATPKTLGCVARRSPSSAVARQKATTRRVSRGSISPSSHSRAVANSAVDSRA